MIRFDVVSTLTDTYGEIRDTLISNVSGDVALDVLNGKVEGYAGTYWQRTDADTGMGSRVARFVHAESGASLTLEVVIAAETPAVSRDYPVTI